MTFEEKVLLDFGEFEDGRGTDSKYSGNEEIYRAYKKAVKGLTNKGYIENALIFEDPKTHEIEVVSLKSAFLTDKGIEKVEKIKKIR